MEKINATYVPRRDTTEIEKVFFKDGFLQVLPYKQIMSYEWVAVLNMCHRFGIYVLPTQELIEFLKTEIEGSAIEIGSGLGSIGRSLKVPFTDSYMQDMPEIKHYYQMLGTPTIAYPPDVQKMDALTSLQRYKPDTVIGAYITHKFNGTSGNVYGVEERAILLRNCKYINIGNDIVHADKPITKHAHRTYRFEWLLSRSEQSKNHIKIWDRK